MSHYDHDYIECDELSNARPVPFGPVRIRCQCCGADVVRRHYIEIDIKSDPPRKEKVLTMVRLGNYGRQRMALSDGSYINLYMCTDCQKNETIDCECDEAKAAKVISQIKRSFMNEDRFGLKAERVVQENSKRWDHLKALKTLKHDLTQKEAHEECVRLCEQRKEKEEKKAEERVK